MSRGALAFKQTDVTRAVKAVTAAGIEVARVEVDKSGRIVIVAGTKGESATANPWDEAVAKLAA